MLSVSVKESVDIGDCLPIVSCGLRLGDETVVTAVGLWFDVDLCSLLCHYYCSSLFDVRELHRFCLPNSAGRAARRYALNDLIACSLASAGVPVTK